MRRILTMMVGFLVAASLVMVIRTDLEVAAVVAEDKRHFVPVASAAKPHQVENLFPSSLKSTELNIVKETEEVSKGLMGMSAQRPVPMSGTKRHWRKQRLRNKLQWNNPQQQQQRRPRRRHRRHFPMGRMQRNQQRTRRRRKFHPRGERLNLEELPENGRGVKTNGYHKVINQQVRFTPII